MVENIRSIATRYLKTGTYDIRRGAFGFDFSGIGTDTIGAVTFSLAGGGAAAKNADSGTISIAVATPASDSNLVADDFNEFEFTVDANKTFANWNGADGAYNDFALDVGKVAYVSSWSDIGFIGTRSQLDVFNTAPSGGNDVTSYFADQTGTTNDPKLIVTDRATAPTPGACGERKPNTQTTTSDSTLTDDEDLEIILAANTEFEIRGTIFASSTSQVPDIKWAFDVPAGSEMAISIVPSSFERAELLQTDAAPSDGIPMLANEPVTIQVSCTVKTSATSGLIRLQWAQHQSDAAFIGVLQGSFLRAEGI